MVGRDPTMRSGFRIIRCVNKKIERRDDSIGTSGVLAAPTWPILMSARIVAGTGGILLNVIIIKMVADLVHQQRDGDGDHRQFGTSRDCAGACHDTLDRQFRRSSVGLPEPRYKG